MLLELRVRGRRVETRMGTWKVPGTHGKRVSGGRRAMGGGWQLSPLALALPLRCPGRGGGQKEGGKEQGARSSFLAMTNWLAVINFVPTVSQCSHFRVLGTSSFFSLQLPYFPLLPEVYSE